MVRRFFAWLASLLAGLAYRLAPDQKPVVTASSPVKWSGGTRTRYQVARWVNGKHFMLYDGPDGAEARQRYEYVSMMKEPGRMEFWMDNGTGKVVRGSYERPS